MGEKEHDISPAREPSVDEGQLAVEKQMRDIGADLYLEVQQYSREELEAERKIVLRKIDWVIMPMVRPYGSMSFSTKTARLTKH
jgi:hypothetical protein